MVLGTSRGEEEPGCAGLRRRTSLLAVRLLATNRELAAALSLTSSGEAGHIPSFVAWGTTADGSAGSTSPLLAGESASELGW
jgi:hypothetical protein